MTKYQLEPSTQREDWWVLTDIEHEIVILFKEHYFNETQKITLLDDKKLLGNCGEEEPATFIARLLREMSEWAAQRHPDIVFPLSTFMVGRNDDGRVTIIRTKYPKFTITVEDSCDCFELQKAVSRLNEYLKKRAK